MMCNKPQALRIWIRNLICSSVANKISLIIVRHSKRMCVADTTERTRSVLILLKTNTFHLSELHQHFNNII
jgi:hypothetical protein